MVEGLSERIVSREEHQRLHELLHTLCVRLPTDFEPYGQRSRETDWAPDCFTFKGETLCHAIRATFERRRTPVSVETPTALTPTFYENMDKIAQWNGFLRKGRIDVERKSLAEVAEAWREFLMPQASAAAKGEEFGQVWKIEGLWLPA
jgi:hypothetical protein